MALESKAFNPVSTVNQEQPLQGQTVGSIAGLENSRVLRSNRWPESNENVKVRKGVIDGFVRTSERWRLKQPQQIVLLGYPGNELAGLPILQGRVRPSQDVMDRIGYVLGISIGLGALFNNSIPNEVDWLNQPQHSLGGAAPMEIMMSGKMLDMIRIFALVSRERAL
jgi:hypothetical protein